MIKVHCFVSCVCEAIKRHHEADHRPFYFGVWDADFAVTDDYQLRYHAESVSHDFFKSWYETLYKIEIIEWFDKAKPKQDNVQSFLELIDHKPKDRNVMVMLDLSRIPSRENKFHEPEFPHYVMIEKTDDPDQWMMYDPDFRWEGVLAKEEVLHAIESPVAQGGFYFDAAGIQPASDDAVRAYFGTCLKENQNPFTEAIKSIVEAYSTGDMRKHREQLSDAIHQIPVLTIRKYAYEHAFAFFSHALSISEDQFERWCDEIEELIQGFRALHFHAIKYAKTGSDKILADLYERIDRQHHREYAIKKSLLTCFRKWEQQTSTIKEYAG
ncbi:DUF6005 family protein [Jeotgalibacillus aurantiacus]|uniref:DUF6005 family protein n=1 Tax=Jeotgalibacillus aurantiacus TaxID=2763266 RepID=UPI001D0AC2AE|nr:DUF6005 family protein [Jeotgalibacillus aurantiacus]